MFPFESSMPEVFSPGICWSRLSLNRSWSESPADEVVKCRHLQCLKPPSVVVAVDEVRKVCFEPIVRS